MPAVLVIENDPADPIARLGDWLRDSGLDLDIRSDADLPDDLAGFAGVVVMGGYMGANDDAVAPWLPHVRRLLRDALAQEVPVLGVCLGGQLLAAAHGGRVERNPLGPEYGPQLIAKRAAASTDPLFRSLPITPDVLQWHVDAITVLPPGAVLLASSPGADVQAFRLGRLAWGLQFHIEATPAMVRLWAADDADELADYDIERIIARSDAADEDIVEAWQPLARAFAAVVADPGSVPRARTVLTSSAPPITDPAQIRAALAAEAQAAQRGPVALPEPFVPPSRPAP